MKWFRFYHDAIDDPKVQRLPGELFRDRFLSAMNGEVNEFTPYMGIGIDERLPFQEWRPLREQIFERDDYACQYCGAVRVPLECDHIVPLGRGGSNHPENLITACKACNRSKGAKLLSEWL